ncbi:MAG: ornithine carbamoyltransferase [Coriobacteriia bacterium]|nr:ornithine carbamoyltransferase [Coriobacteriia bacterium]
MNSLYHKDILTLFDLTSVELDTILTHAARFKAAFEAHQVKPHLDGLNVAIIMQKPSLRTRVSFEVACLELGARPLVLSGDDNAFSRGESEKDTAAVLSRYLDAVVVRTSSDEMLATFARHADIPVINALTDGHHPCQGLADLLTIQEHFAAHNGMSSATPFVTLEGFTFAYVGDGSNNMAHTYLAAAALAGMHLRIATPASLMPDSAIRAQADKLAQTTGATLTVTDNPHEAVKDAQVVATDTWASMGQETERRTRLTLLESYQVNAALMAHAAPEAIFLHCLPAHRGEEVTDDVIDAPYSLVVEQAANRLHAQAALLTLLLDKEGKSQ